MADRVVYACVAILFTLTIIALDWRLSLDIGRVLEGAPLDAAKPWWVALIERGSFIPLTLLALVLMGYHEMRHMLRRMGIRAHWFVSLATIIALTLCPWLSAGGLLGVRPDRMEGFHGTVALLMLGSLWLFIAQVTRERAVQSLVDVCSTFFIMIYLGLLPSFAIYIRSSIYLSPGEGAWLLFSVILVIKASDIGGYLFGTLLGRHKITPNISPSKSIEGTLGGILLSVAVSVGFALASRSVGLWLLPTTGSPISPSPFQLVLSDIVSPLGQIGVSNAAIFGVVMGIVALMGDLFESCLKRAAQVKDSARLIPRVGGILDVTDSLYLGVPVAWLMFSTIWGVI